MDFMVILQFIVLLGGIYLGVKLGGMGVGRPSHFGHEGRYEGYPD